jgi:trimethylamine:corrinoid methyltransferase-like protein
VSDRQAYEVWRASGRTELDLARERVKDLLDQHERRGSWADATTAAAVRETCGLGGG